MTTTMTRPSTPPPPRSSKAGPRTRRKRLSRAGATLLAQGEPMVWLTGGALAIAMTMIIGLLLFILAQGAATFWPAQVQWVTLADGTVYMGEVTRSQWYAPQPNDIAAITDDTARQAAEAQAAKNEGTLHRRLLRTGNYELTNTHFQWVDDFAVAQKDKPRWAMTVERQEWGRFYGLPGAFVIDDQAVASTDGLTGTALDEARQQVWEQFNAYHGQVIDRLAQMKHMDKKLIGHQNARINAARLEATEARLDFGEGSKQHKAAMARQETITVDARAEIKKITDERKKLSEENERYRLVMVTAQDQSRTLPLGDVVRIYPANQLGFFDRLGVYGSRWWEFVSQGPREANQEGGVFPAIFGTVLMTLIMSIAVVPFGVLAALYLREYAKAGPIISAVRIAINNLAGVPSIVFGVFGLGFFCYLVGGFIDGGAKNIDASSWSVGLWLAVAGVWLMAVVGGLVLWSTLLSAKKMRTLSMPMRAVRGLLAMGWVVSVVLIALAMIVYVPEAWFSGLFRAKLEDNQSTFGTGGLMWASLTLALLTLPVVIVATEEALAAVPNSMREGSYGCGASKWQTIHRIVLPRAMPGIMTGAILAMARGAGEVAPLMLVGAMKLVPELPGRIDGEAPYVHVESSFMHLGFHIYDVGFQSPNSEAAKPMVYTTTLLLIVIIALLNVLAIWLRGRLRRRFVGSQF